MSISNGFEADCGGIAADPDRVSSHFARDLRHYDISPLDGRSAKTRVIRETQ
jgi:hypothetical protein